MADKLKNSQDVKPETKETKDASILIQMGIFAGILFVSSIISPMFPASFPVPTPVIGLVLLYLLLTVHVIKIEWVEKFANFLIGFIAFLFVPSGIQLTASLDIMRAQGVQLVATIVISTVILLVVIAYTASFFIWVKKTVFKRDVSVQE